jgi:5-methylcytosine-specific restriction enzyme A
MRFCRCGAIVKDRCPRCDPKPKHKLTTAQRGYDHRWRKLSEHIRTENPLCKRCESLEIVTPSTEVHHIVPITQNPALRYELSNLIALCRECHELLEGKTNTSESKTW